MYHFSPINMKYAVKYKNKIVSVINAKLLKDQNAEDNLEKIKKLHLKRFKILSKMKESCDVVEQKKLYKQFVKNEKDLQLLWNFEVNDNHISFWNVPHCKCPVMDNEDNYPHGPYYYNAECPIHG